MTILNRAIASVAQSATSVAILAEDAARERASITNDATARLYLRLASGDASTAGYSVSLAQHETFILEGSESKDSVSGIWAAAGAGAALVTTMTR